MSTDRGVGQLSAVPGMHASGLTITARTPSPVALRFRGDADRGTDPTYPRDNNTKQVGQQRPHALEITRRRSSPAAGQHTVATRQTPSRKLRQIHFQRAPSIATSRGRPRCSLALLRMQSGGSPGPLKNYKPGRSGHEGIEVSRSVRVQRTPAGLSAYRPPIPIRPPSCRRWLPRSPPSVRGGDRGTATRQAMRRQGLAPSTIGG